MQSKGAIKFFAIAFALVCLFQLSFTFFTLSEESNAKDFARNDEALALAKQLADGNAAKENILNDSIAKVREKYYLDSMANQVVYNPLWIRKYTYQECKEREINLGLDLKGGMNVMLEVSVVDIIRELGGNNPNPVFQQALKSAVEKQKNSQKDFVSLFAESFNEIDPNASMASIFAFEFKDKGIDVNSTNDEVVRIIREESNGAIDRAFNILRTRIDRFGVAQPTIQKLATTGRILVELPGIKEPERVRKLLQGTAQLEFWETYKFSDLYSYFAEANNRLVQRNAMEEKAEEASTTEPAKEDAAQAEASEEKTAESVADTTSSLEKLLSDSTAVQPGKDSFQDYARKNPLFAYLNPAVFPDQSGQYFPSQGSTVGYAQVKDTARINNLLKKVKNVFPRNLRLSWTVKPEKDRPDILELVALKEGRDGKASLGGDVIVDARQDYSQTGQVEISMQMNTEGARIWKRLTADNIGNQVAIVLDGFVYSAPRVNDEIPNGRSSITGQYGIEEAQDLANILKAGKLPAPAKIVQEEVVGPSLGREAINAGFISFILALIMVMILMVVYYNKAGWVADLALLTNMFFLLGVLASLGAVLTLPGIAGIVLTIGMAVDANVIIYERIREEVRSGKGIRLAVNDGYKNAYSAIIDGNLTTLLTGIVLYVFGSGPVQGFATTLIIGILSSLFTAIFISRIIFNYLLDKNHTLVFDTNLSRNAFTKINIDFISKRKTFYVVSAVFILIGIGSLVTRGLNKGVDFSGGRTYVVRFDKDVNTNDIRKALQAEFNDAPEVKTFGPSSQVKITTKYLIDDDGASVDSIIESKLYKGLNPMFTNAISYEEFTSDSEDKLIGRLSSQKVGPTIADDLVRKSYLALGFALIAIFLYIAGRFRKWQYGLGGIATLAHDALITVSMYSLLYGIVPFSLEVDQSFIAAILTIIGYSINDSVIIFDRIREYTTLYPKRILSENINSAINSTLGRTFMTSMTTLLVLIMICVFGGEIIRGFSFALIVGVVVGTYSSIFISTPVAYDLSKDKSSAKLAK